MSCKTCECEPCQIKRNNTNICQEPYMPCNGPWIIDRGLAKGGYGEVSYVCKGQDCDYVIKESKESMKNEIRLQSIAADYDLAPAIIYSAHTDSGDMYIMRELAYTANSYLTHLFKKNRTKDAIREALLVYSTLFTLLDDVHAIGIYHGDAHLDNFMYDKNKGEWQIIDFGLASKVTKNTDLSKDYTYLIDSPDEVMSAKDSRLPELQKQVQELFDSLIGDDFVFLDNRAH